MPEITPRQIDKWLLKERKPEGDGPHPFILLLHGWTGDENSMWIFSTRLPSQYWLAAPRGLYTSPGGGSSWIEAQGFSWPRIDEFFPAADALIDLLTPANFPSADLSQVFLAGFSQGAALAYSFAWRHPARVKAIAGLSGFVPEGAETLAENKPLLGKHIFVAHGTQDEIVPVVMARWGVSIMQQAGAKVSYCEDDVGHKLSSSCFGGFQSFFRAMEF